MVDYSKWKKIEISDDEDETHPNIDTASLFRWRHKARLERAEEQRQKSSEMSEKRAQLTKQLETEQDAEQRKVLEAELSELNRKEEDAKKRERRQPWNVDTIGQESWSGTVLNKKCLTSAVEDADYENNEAAISSYEAHVAAYEDAMKEFAFHGNFEDCRRFLLSQPDIVSQFTVDYLSLWCVQLHLDDKHALLAHVSRQAVLLQMILDLAKTVGKGCDPRSCLGIFFERSARAKGKFDQLLADELVTFGERIEKAAQYRIEQAISQQETDPKALIGPGGLNAQEVFDSLPEELQKCFESRSREQMHTVLASMDPEQATYHLQRCVDAGLWNPEREEDEDERLLAEKMKNAQMVTTNQEGTFPGEPDSSDLSEDL